MKRILILLAAGWLLASMAAWGLQADMENPEVFKGEILEIISDEMTEYTTSGSSYRQRVQIAEVLLKNGPHEGRVIEVANYIDEIMAYNMNIEEGDDIYVLMNYDENGEIIQGYVYEHQRDKYLYMLVAAFLVLMLLIGGIKGLKSLVTLALTVVGVYYMIIGIMQGGNPILLSIVVSALVTVVTMTLVGGFNLKALSAIFGTIGGVLIAGLIALAFSKTANLTGLGTSEAQMLLFSEHPVEFNFSSILFASILIGTLGAVMDVSMSIASAINEIIEANPLLSTMDLFQSGMNIGKDVMGTMANTLILAYTGTSIFLLLVFLVNDVPYRDVINMDMVATEIVRAVTGTIGLITSIPITGMVSAILEKKRVSL